MAAPQVWFQDLFVVLLCFLSLLPFLYGDSGNWALFFVLFCLSHFPTHLLPNIPTEKQGDDALLTCFRHMGGILYGSLSEPSLFISGAKKISLAFENKQKEKQRRWKRMLQPIMPPRWFIKCCSPIMFSMPNATNSIDLFHS